MVLLYNNHKAPFKKEKEKSLIPIFYNNYFCETTVIEEP